MKKLIIIATLFAFVEASNAVSFKWAVGTGDVSAPATLNGTNLGNTYQVYLFFLDSSTSYDSAFSLDGSINTGGSVMTATGLNAPPTNKGKIFDQSYTWSETATTANGKNFIAVLATTSGGETYYNVSDVLTVSGWTLGTEAPSFVFDFNFANAPAGTSGAAGAGWYKYVPVPEPATAALAFVGLAMLIRRRK